MERWQLSLLSVLPESEGGAPTSGIAELGSGHFLKTPVTLRHVQSEDGSRVFWTVQDPSVELGEGALYLRDTQKRQSVRLDIPEEGLAQNEAPRSPLPDGEHDGLACVLH